MRKQYIPNSRLTQGTVYPFKFLKAISLDGYDEWFVMLDPFGYKILMPAKYYALYGFEAGQHIMCRVDKVNCNGRVFLEPEHPYYKEGYSYAFELVRTVEQASILDQQDAYFTVKDRLGLEWKVPVFDKPCETDHSGHVNCRVVRIKKGKLYLAVEGRQNQTQLQPGYSYLFTISGELANPEDGFTYFVLSDETGQKHLLRKKYYHHYGLSVGSSVRCKVGNFSYDGRLHLEPEHPCYEAGLIFDFYVSHMEALIFSDGFIQKVLVLHDCFGEEVKVHVSDQQVQYFETNECIRAHVLRVYKSRPELEILAPDY